MSNEYNTFYNFDELLANMSKQDGALKMGIVKLTIIY